MVLRNDGLGGEERLKTGPVIESSMPGLLRVRLIEVTNV
jgi:hypothetical protein